jgi:flagellar motor protein MotB
LSRRRRVRELFPLNVWPPFVDAAMLAVAALLLFMLLGFVAQRSLAARLKEREDEVARLRQDKKLFERRLQGFAASGVLAVDDGKVILQGEVLFDSGSDVLREGGRTLMTDIGRELASVLVSEPDQMVLVGGHTDDRPVVSRPASANANQGRHFANNWDLSTARALAVAHILIGAGVPAEKLVAAGFGEHHPRVPNADESNRAQNRRIEVLLVPIRAVASR